mgnify:CR=1 FL=1|tara:strand:- start:3227 stop:3664 length:438 start_codon:yes stop_codon:yes gene_type:complete
MDVCDVPGSWVFGGFHRSVNELLETQTKKPMFCEAFSEFNYVVVAKGRLEPFSTTHSLLGIIPVKQYNKEHLFSLVATRKHAEAQDLLHCMISHVISVARQYGAARIYYTSDSPDVSLEATLRNCGFVYETSAGQLKTVEMVLSL